MDEGFLFAKMTIPR